MAFRFAPHLISNPVPLGVGGSWSLVFDDEFTGGNGVPDPAVWRWYYQSVGVDGTNMAEDPDYHPEWTDQVGGIVQSCLTQTGGQMHVLGLNSACRYGAQDFSYSRGVARTQRTFLPTAGHGFYFEARLWLPAGQGFWPAFWMWPPDADQLSTWHEIDWLECPSNAASGFYTNVHWGDANAPQQSGPNLHNGSVVGPVVIGGVWRTNEIRFYKNGVEVDSYTTAANIPSVPLNLIVDFQIGGSWPGNPDGSTTWPASVDCDYVRVWQE